MWKTKEKNYYDFNVSYDDIYPFCNPIAIFQIKDHRDEKVNIIIIYEADGTFTNKGSHKYVAKIKSRHLWDSPKVEVGTYSKILSDDNLFMLKWDCVKEISQLGWDISKDFLTFIKGE